ncbi:MAG: radical SAM/SPASM domain-containing protein [Candidatus Omnitrophota bacterium]
MTKIETYPKRVVVELTPECNLSCPMCPRKYIENKSGFMQEALYKKIIDDIAVNNSDSIMLPFWRGESLLHPRFIAMIDYALAKSIRIHISTNGILVKGEYALTLAKCEFTTFSIHNKEGFENAKAMLSLKKCDKPTTQVSFVKGEAVLDKVLPSIIKTGNLCGFDSVRVYEEHTKDGVFGKSGGVVDTERIFCPKLTDTLVIAFDGSISRCNHIWDTEGEANAAEMTIKELWSSECLQKIRGGYPDRLCGPCDQWIGHTRGESWRVKDNKSEHLIFK